MKRLYATIIAAVLAVPAFAQTFQYPDGQVLEDGLFDRAAEYVGPYITTYQQAVALADVPCTGGIPVTRPAFQAAYNGIYHSLTTPDHQMYWSQSGSSVQVTLLLGTGAWVTGEIFLTDARTEILLPLYAPVGGPPVGAIKLCSPSSSHDRPTLCTNIHARAVINGELAFPLASTAPGCGAGNTSCLQRFADRTEFPGAPVPACLY